MAQNVHASGQPDCDERQAVRRLRCRMSTASSGNPSCVAMPSLIVPSPDSRAVRDRELAQRRLRGQVLAQRGGQRRQLGVLLREAARRALVHLSEPVRGLAAIGEDRADLFKMHSGSVTANPHPEVHHADKDSY